MITRRELLVRLGGLVAALGLGTLYQPLPRDEAPAEAPMTASEVLRLLQQHNPIIDDLSWKAAGFGKDELLSMRIAWEISQGKSVSIMTTRPEMYRKRVEHYLEVIRRLV